MMSNNLCLVSIRMNARFVRLKFRRLRIEFRSRQICGVARQNQLTNCLCLAELFALQLVASSLPN